MNVIVIGGGQVGSYIAKLLHENNCKVKVIENRELVLEKIKRELQLGSIIFGNGTDPNVLEAAGIAEADVVACVTGADETNLVASTIAKFEFGISRVVARVNNPKNSWLFDSSMGVDVGLNQADLLAHLVVEEMDLKNIMTLLKINQGEYSIIQVNVDDNSKAVGKSVKELMIPVEAVIIAISRKKEIIIPRGETIIAEGDSILALTDANARVAIKLLFNK